MKITEIREKTFQISSPIRNAYIDFSKMTLSLVAVVTDVVRGGNRVVGYAEKPAKEFKFNPYNWRQHGNLQRSALNSVLSRIGWVTPGISRFILPAAWPRR